MGNGQGGGGVVEWGMFFPLFFGIVSILEVANGRFWTGMLFFVLFGLAALMDGGPSYRRRADYDDRQWDELRDRSALPFADAFADARERGLKSFRWRGGHYHTRTAEEDAATRL